MQHGQQVALCKTDGTVENVKVSRLYQFEGLRRVEVPEASLGDLVAVSGITDLNIGETACDPECIEPLPFVKIDEPTISMNFMVNNSPFAGKEANSLPPAIFVTAYSKRWKQTSACAWRKRKRPTASKFPAAASCIFPF